MQTARLESCCTQMQEKNAISNNVTTKFAA